MAFPNQRPNASRNRQFGTNQATRPPFRGENSNNSFSGRFQNQINTPPFRRENSNSSFPGRFQNQTNNPPFRRENSNGSFSGRFQNQTNNPPFRRENSNGSFSGRFQNPADHSPLRKENSNSSFSGRFQNPSNHSPIRRENSNSSFSGRFQNPADHSPLREENSNSSFSGRFHNQANNPPFRRENSNGSFSGRFQNPADHSPLRKENSNSSFSGKFHNPSNHSPIRRENSNSSFSGRFQNSPRPFRMGQLRSSLGDVRVSSNSERFKENNVHRPDPQHQTRQMHHPPPKCASLQFGYECGQLLDCLKSIQGVVQCYECHKPLTSARTCLNGHGICSNCRTRCNKNCPICHSVILDLKPIMLNEIVKLLPKQCKNSTKGCELLVLPKDSDHEKFCRFRNTDCRFPSCDWEGMAKDLLLHLENFHGDQMIRVATQTQILMRFNTTEDREGLAVIVAFNNIFWRHVRVSQNQLIQFYQYIPMEKPKKQYLVAVEYYTPKTHFKKVVPVHTDVFDRNQLFNDPESFRLPKKVAKSFNEFHSGVHFIFTISQTDI